MIKMQVKNKSSIRIRVVSIVALLAVLIALSVVLSFAWFQNNIDVEGTGVTTGKMLYEFKGYHYDAAGDLISDFNYSTADGENGTQESDSVNLNSVNPTSPLAHFTPIDALTQGQSFFTVSRLEGSIDFDVALTFDLEGLAATDAGGNTLLGANGAAMNYINNMWFKFYDESGALIAYMGTAGNTVDGYIASTEGTDETAAKLTKTEDIKNLSEILGVYITGKLQGANDQFIIRMVYGWNTGVLAPQHTDVRIPIRVNLNVAQVGALGGEGTSQTVRVTTAEELRAALDNYMPGDTIVIGSDMTYVGDIIIARPVDLMMLGSTLTIQGNLSYVYMYEETFKINTQGGGQLVIKKNTNGLGGNLIADLPASALELIGTNSDEAGKADVYIEGDLRVRASLSAGLKLNASRVCALEPSGDLAASVTLKEIIVTGASRIHVAARTYAGKITANNDCGRIILVNNGFIAQLDLQAMYRDSALTTVPVIDIDSYGYWVDPLIRLPQWSVKFLTPDRQPEGSPAVYTGNTSIKSNMGSGLMKAVSLGHEAFINGHPDAAFFSDKELVGIRNDIDYEFREEFVEVLNEEKTEILVHYELPDATTANKYTATHPNFGAMLADTIDYYISIGDVAAQNQLMKVTVICYGENELTAADYAYLRGMSALESLDISECVSTDKQVPAEALQGLSNLSTVKMPEYDTVWNPNILAGTAVEELHFTANLQKLANSTTYDSKNKKDVENYDVIGNIRIIHTKQLIPAGTINTYGIHHSTANMVFNQSVSRDVRQYFFVPDAATLELYRELFGTSVNPMVWRRCVFLEAERYGDYFLRVNDTNMTCEFVTCIKMGAFDPAVESFDFETITVNSKTYTITSYDDYAFCYRFSDTLFELELPVTVNSVGTYAFSGSYHYHTNVNPQKGSISRLTLLGNTDLGYRAFALNDRMTEVVGTQVTSAAGEVFYNCTSMTRAQLNSLSVVTGAGLFSGCTSLKRLDIGLIEQTDTNKTDFTYNVPSTILVEIHTAGYALPAYEKALTSPLGRTFVQDFYAPLYADHYGHLAELGTHTMQTILRADANGNILPLDTPQEDVAYYFFPVLDAQGNETDKTVLSACMLAHISGSGNDLGTISTFTDGVKTYTVTRIGRAAYRTTAMSMIKTLKIPDAVTEIGYGAFAGGDSPKYCITLDLNNVVKLEREALYQMSMVRLYGNKVVEAAPKSIANMPSLVVACLPVLDTMGVGIDTASKTFPNNESIFHTCGSLRVAYVGPSSNVRYLKNDNSGNTVAGVGASNKKALFFFINPVGISKTCPTSFTHMLAYVGGDTNANYTWSGTGGVIPLGENFSKAIFSDWYDLSGSVGDTTYGTVSYSVTLPGYLYYPDSANSTDLTLAKTTNDFSLLPGVEDYASLYLTPEVLYQEGTITYYDADHTDDILGATVPRYVAREDVGGEYAYKVTAIANRCYNYTAVNTEVMKIGRYTKTIDGNLFAYAATLNAKTLDLSNVESVGSSGFSNATGVTKLIADHVKTTGTSAFQGLGIKTAYLPALQRCDSYLLHNCALLEEVVLGPEFESGSTNPFYSCKSLKKVVFLNPEKVIPLFSKHSNGSYMGDVSVEKDLIVVVAAKLLKDTDGDGVYDTYTDGTRTYTLATKYGNTPLSNFTIFEGFTSEGQLTFFWKDNGNGTASISSMVGSPSAALNFPDTVTNDDGDTLAVVSVEDGVFTMLPATVETIVLPDYMQFMTFLPSSLPASVKALQIAAENTKFATDSNGILYGKNSDGDLVSVYLFPQDLRIEGLAFTLPDTVTTIECEAFYSLEYLTTLNITNPVTIRDRAFANSKNLTTINFASSTPSVFAGRDIFLGGHTGLILYVPRCTLPDTDPNTYLDAYRASVWHDFSILSMFALAHAHSYNDFGYCTAEGCPDPEAALTKWEGANSMSLPLGSEALKVKVTFAANTTYQVDYQMIMGGNRIAGLFGFADLTLTSDYKAAAPEIFDAVEDLLNCGFEEASIDSDSKILTITTGDEPIELCFIVPPSSAAAFEYAFVITQVS
ncbi:MAG: hypothetical protein E7639_04895 [Ruminococcaceae bacterium]|nr:hypothetical protein [Oscillospiraceae bacterium]